MEIFKTSAGLLMAVGWYCGQPVEGVEVPRVATFFKSYCVECHGGQKQEGEVQLDRLGAPVLEGGDGQLWLAVLDVLEAGDMPPKKVKERPGRAEVDAVVNAISEALESVKGEAEIGLRRMNRTEYESTVRDLLGVEVSLKDLLPEDGEVQGFDNVADGLSLSSVLMERYLEAADVAFDAVIRRIPPLPAATRRARIMDGKENISSVKESKGGTVEVDGGFVKFTPGWPPVRMDEIHPIEDGRYRCRIAVWPHDPGGRTLSLAVYVGPLFGPGKRRFMGMFDVTGSPGEPRVIEFETWMDEGDAMHLEPWVYPEHVTWRDREKEGRPGIAVAWAETHGPLDQSFPSEAQKRLFGEVESITLEPGVPIWMRHRKGMKLHDVVSTQPAVDAERIVRAFVPRAFRRPVGEGEVAPYVALTLGRLEAGRTFEQAVRSGVKAVLCSPGFLLLNDELEVDGFTLASRLSTFLWSSMPDDELMALAAAGRLGDAGVRRDQVVRMLGDARAERFVESFVGQWLGVREIEDTTPDKNLYPEFDPLLQESMVRETRGFFRHVLQNDLSVMNFVDSDFAFLNQRLAEHYGIEGVVGHEVSRVVELAEESVRGGVLAQGGVLKVTANGTTTSPVLRGVWALENILGRPVPPPPPGVPAVEPDIRGTTTIREQLAAHSEDASCARCHARIDPPGFALERFDPIGGEREWYRAIGEGQRLPGKRYSVGPEVDCSGQMPGGEVFVGFEEFRAQLLEGEERFVRVLAEKLLVYGSGRRMTWADRGSVDAVVERVMAGGVGLREMILAVVESEMFLRP
ncbi:MAG: DUF1592 domain-containing protein [Verrucomicrobiales bacterium]|nr:DUF1592 domain-containing protein [Verrucomicrobiales bacterium]